MVRIIQTCRSRYKQFRGNLGVPCSTAFGELADISAGWYTDISPNGPTGRGLHFDGDPTMQGPGTIYFLVGYLAGALPGPSAVMGQSVLYVDRNATGPAFEGATWCDAFLTLDSALDVATPGTTIRVAEGTYTPNPDGLPNPREATFQLANGVMVEGGYAGCGAPDPDERDVVEHETILSGDVNGDDGVNCCYSHGTPGCVDAVCEDAVCDDDPFCCETTWDGLCANSAANLCESLCAETDESDNAYHVVTGSETDATAVLDGFTVRRGKANGPDPHDRGGGMLNVLGSPSVNNCRFDANFAGQSGAGNYGYGGGVYNENSTATFTYCTFTENVAAATYPTGGAICNYGASASLSNCILVGNRVSGLSPSGGAASNINGGSPVFTACAFNENLASGGSGGGMANKDSSAPTLTNCTFDRNTAYSSGGGIFNLGNCKSVLIGCTFRDNNAEFGAGGGISSHDQCNATVKNCDFIRNSPSALSTDRGALTLIDCAFIDNSGPGVANSRCDATVTNCVFIGNTSENHGAGMTNAFSNPTLTNCTFTDNIAGGRGGGIHNGGSSPTLINCVFTGNTAGEFGGGMESNSLSSEDSSPTLVNCTFIGNSAVEQGGAIYQGRGVANVTNCVFLGNSADVGGGLRVSVHDTWVTNCTFFGNSATTDGGGMRMYSGQWDLTGEAVHLENSIFWGNSDAGGTDESAQVFSLEDPPLINYSNVQGWTGAMGGVGNNGEDPSFADAIGGDVRLSPASPAIDAGDPGFVPDPGVPDLDGHARVLCGRVDMGAYEFGIGDFDCDRDVDLFDFAEWSACFTGPANGPHPAGCEAFDFNADSDIDLHDFAPLQRAFTP